MTLRCISRPSLLPLSLAEVKAHLRVDDSSEDSIILIYLKAATSLLDGEDGRLYHCIMPQAWEARFDYAFPNRADGRIIFGLGPVVSITSVTYVDTSGVAQTLSPSVYVFQASTDNNEAYISPVYGASWPPTRYQLDAVSIVYQTGYADALSVPDDLKHAILLLVGHWYKNREAVRTGMQPFEIPIAFEAIIDKLRKVVI